MSAIWLVRFCSGIPKRFEQICRVVSSMRGVRVGAIGARPAGFNTVRYSENYLERLGIAVETLDLSEVFTCIKCLRDDDIRVDENVVCCWITPMPAPFPPTNSSQWQTVCRHQRMGHR